MNSGEILKEDFKKFLTGTKNAAKGYVKVYKSDSDESENNWVSHNLVYALNMIVGGSLAVAYVTVGENPKVEESIFVNRAVLATDFCFMFSSLATYGVRKGVDKLKKHYKLGKYREMENGSASLYENKSI